MARPAGCESLSIRTHRTNERQHRNEVKPISGCRREYARKSLGQDQPGEGGIDMAPAGASVRTRRRLVADERGERGSTMATKSKDSRRGDSQNVAQRCVWPMLVVRQAPASAGVRGVIANEAPETAGRLSVVTR